MIPFLSVLLIGSAAIYIWPATYFSEGKILVQSQQIPTELVRPTVTSAALVLLGVASYYASVLLVRAQLRQFRGEAGNCSSLCCRDFFADIPEYAAILRVRSRPASAMQVVVTRLTLVQPR